MTRGYDVSTAAPLVYTNDDIITIRGERRVHLRPYNDRNNVPNICYPVDTGLNIAGGGRFDFLRRVIDVRALILIFVSLK
jgi:hypothetical protein